MIPFAAPWRPRCGGANGAMIFRFRRRYAITILPRRGPCSKDEALRSRLPLHGTEGRGHAALPQLSSGSSLHHSEKSHCDPMIGQGAPARVPSYVELLTRPRGIRMRGLRGGSHSIRGLQITLPCRSGRHTDAFTYAVDVPFDEMPVNTATAMPSPA